jgi:hypothetical protein
MHFHQFELLVYLHLFAVGVTNDQERDHLKRLSSPIKEVVEAVYDRCSEMVSSVQPPPMGGLPFLL